MDKYLSYGIRKIFIPQVIAAAVNLKNSSGIITITSDCIVASVRSIVKSAYCQVAACCSLIDLFKQWLRKTVTGDKQEKNKNELFHQVKNLNK